MVKLAEPYRTVDLTDGRAVRNPNRRRLAARVGMYASLTVIAIVFFFPFYWMVTSAFRPQALFYKTSASWWPSSLSLENFHNLFTQSLFARGLFNSVLLAVAAVVLQVFFSSLAGYAFAKMRFRGRQVLFIGVLATLMLPASVQLVPNFLMMAKFHWIDTYWSLIIPGIANAFGIFWMRQYCRSVPDELLDAARVDGASEFTIYWRIVLPVIQPAIASLSIFIFLTSWNDLLRPLVFLRSRDMFTSEIWLTIVGQNGHVPQPGVVMAGSLLASIPSVILFATLQRRFIAGLTAGSVR